MNRADFSCAAFVVAALAGAAGLSGCAAPDATSIAAGSHAQAQGFKDGCQSGEASQGSPFSFLRKDAARFDADKPYAQGWSAGYQQCADRQMQKNASGNGR